jgi:hypothetical protein
VLLGARRQDRPADSITVSCDGDGITEDVRCIADELALEILLVERAHQGEARPSQVRNNAVRALCQHRETIGSVLVFLDGDCCPGPVTLARHEELARSADLVIGFRHDLTAEQTEAFDEQALFAGERPIVPTPGQIMDVERRRRRTSRHVLLRRAHLTKPHKPKILSANFAVRFSMFARINGFDEEYIGWGAEDDDLARRVYKAGGRPALAPLDAAVYHMHHETRAVGSWKSSPGAHRLRRNVPAWCWMGMDNPADQPEPTITWLTPPGALS